jgi:hypothetical protein
MGKHETVITTRCSAEQAIQFIMDVSRWPGWHPGNIEARPNSAGPLDVGATFREVFWLLPPFKGQATYRVTAHEPGRRFEFESLTGPVQVKIWYRAEPVPEGAQITLGNETQTSRRMKIFERLFPNMGQQIVEIEARKLKALLERSPKC